MTMKTQVPPTVVDVTRPPGLLAIGVQVEVRNRFEDRWTHGFSVAVIGDDAYQLRRLSDGHVLPAWFGSDVVRIDQTT